MKKILNALINGDSGDRMMKKGIETQLVKRTSIHKQVCTHCKAEISAGEMFHQEEGVTGHLHSLIARRFCSECYARYGKHILTGGKK